MPGKRLAIAAVLFSAWVAFAAWQYQRFRFERSLIGESIHQSSHAVMSALVGGIRSHRRLGRFFEQQLDGMLSELIRSEDVLAAAIISRNGKTLLEAGRVELLQVDPSIEAGDSWLDAGFRMVQRFHVEPAVEGTPWRDGGGGFSSGRGMGWRREHGPAEDGPFAEGGTYFAILLLDRSRHDQLVERSFWSCVLISLAGGLLMICVTILWRASVRLVEARGRERVLELETRHWRELSQAAAGLAHETRNPLGLIRGWTQRLGEDGVDPTQRRQQCRMMMEECDRVTARINQFLAFARPCEPNIQRVEICHLIEQLQIILQPDLEAKCLRLECASEGDTQAIRADRELLRQALFNLVQNAIQFAPEDSTVAIRLRRSPQGRYRVEVADHGPGVSPEAEASLFTPYFTTRADGTGLGLAIVRRIALAHGWEAHYDARPGGGAIFSLEGIYGSDETDNSGSG
jgi:signal transduction histidine kinase